MHTIQKEYCTLLSHRRQFLRVTKMRVQYIILSIQPHYQGRIQHTCILQEEAEREKDTIQFIVLQWNKIIVDHIHINLIDKIGNVVLLMQKSHQFSFQYVEVRQIQFLEIQYTGHFGHFTNVIILNFKYNQQLLKQTIQTNCLAQWYESLLYRIQVRNSIDLPLNLWHLYVGHNHLLLLPN